MGHNDHREQRLTVFCFLVCIPDGGPCFNVDDDGCTDRRTVGDGAPNDNEATDLDVFCFLRDAETVGLAL